MCLRPFDPYAKSSVGVDEREHKEKNSFSCSIHHFKENARMEEGFLPDLDPIVEVKHESYNIDKVLVKEPAERPSCDFVSAVVIFNQSVKTDGNKKGELRLKTVWEA